MKKNEKREQKNRFSYLDIFFLLFLGLILSVILFLFLEAGEQKKEEFYQVELSSSVSAELEEVIPQEGESLLDDEGEELGRILSVKTEKTGEKMSLKIICLISGDPPRKGDTIHLETKNFISDMKVLSVVSEK